MFLLLVLTFDLYVPVRLAMWHWMFACLPMQACERGWQLHVGPNRRTQFLANASPGSGDVLADLVEVRLACCLIMSTTRSDGAPERGLRVVATVAV